MNTKIKTNRLKYTINRNQFANQFDLFCLETSDKYVKRGAYILDATILCDGIKAIKFESGKRILVLMIRSEGNLKILKDLIKNIEGGDRYTVGIMKLDNIPDNVIIQLLFNALSSYDSEYLKFNNLTGHLYCFHPAWIKHGKEKGADIIWGLQSLEIVITKNMCISLPVRSFTSELLKNKISFVAKRFEDYPKYVFSANNTLSRRLKDSTEPCFIMRQVDGTKKEVPFINIQSIDKFEQTKMGMLVSILEIFNRKYDGICNLGFTEYDITERVDYTRICKREDENRIKAVLSDYDISIVDQIGDEYSGVFCNNIRTLLKDKYEVDATVGRRINKSKLNLVLVHNAAYYDGVNDPYILEHKDAAVQHITLEDFSDSSEFTLSSVVNEIVIKNDLRNRRISLYDWQSMGVGTDISFGMEYELDEQNRYFFMTVHRDGTFDITEQEYTLFEMNEYTELLDIFETAKTNSEIVKGVIRFGEGTINVIKDTAMFTIPEISLIKDRLESGDNKLRSKECREELLSSSLDIKMFDLNGEKHYFVGVVGEGMKPSIQRSAVIRRIEGMDGTHVDMTQILKLMNVSFVHNGQLTVVPFPFKYLREYVRLGSWS